MRVFVYGSLLAGEESHALLRRATFVRSARTSPHFTLRDLGAFPAMFSEGTHSVNGEVYEVDVAVLAELDRFEDHPRLYVRKTISLEDGESSEAYLMDEDEDVPREESTIPSGCWRTHRAGA